MGRLQDPTRVCPNMVPMIDIVSQLVIFFMLASTFISAEVDSSIELPDLTDSTIKQDTKEAANPYKLVINMASDDGRALIGMRIGMIDLLKEANARGGPNLVGTVLAERLAVNKKKAAERGGKLQVIIRADKRLAWSNVQQIMFVISTAGVQDVRLSGPINDKIKS